MEKIEMIKSKAWKWDNMQESLFWLYLINSVFLINHEIDSAYWHEWDLFKIKGGVATFLILHFPLLFFVLYGLIMVNDQTFEGLVFSLILSLIGILAFLIHLFFIKKGPDLSKKLVKKIDKGLTIIINYEKLKNLNTWLIDNKLTVNCWVFDECTEIKTQQVYVFTVLKNMCKKVHIFCFYQQLL